MSAVFSYLCGEFDCIADLGKFLCKYRKVGIALVGDACVYKLHAFGEIDLKYGLYVLFKEERCELIGEREVYNSVNTDAVSVCREVDVSLIKYHEARIIERYAVCE